MQYKARIAVTLRPSILDPEGKATQHALHNLGYDSVEQVRIGKHIEMWVEAPHEEEARRIADEAADRVLANPVIEDYVVEAVTAVSEPV